MLLSIVIPVYNAQKYLNKSLESIGAATTKEIEVILVDDGSKDSSSQICDEWQKKDDTDMDRLMDMVEEFSEKLEKKEAEKNKKRQEPER